MEMSKLEASLSEMERELTRQEAAHSRERRALLDREASALSDGQRFRNRSILLEREVRLTGICFYALLGICLYALLGI